MPFALFCTKTFKSRPETLRAEEPEKGNTFLPREQWCSWHQMQSPRISELGTQILSDSTVLCSKKGTSGIAMVRGTLEWTRIPPPDFPLLSLAGKTPLVAESPGFPGCSPRLPLCHFEPRTNCLDHRCPCGTFSSWHTNVSEQEAAAADDAPAQCDASTPWFHRNLFLSSVPLQVKIWQKYRAFHSSYFVDNVSFWPFCSPHKDCKVMCQYPQNCKCIGIVPKTILGTNLIFFKKITHTSTCTHTILGASLLWLR